MPKITPFLWFDGKAEEAARFYTSIFPDSKIKTITYYGDAGPGPKGSVMTVLFELDGQEFVALNGGPEFKFTEAISLSVACKNQEEIDEYWEKLSAGGEKIECGWLKDRSGSRGRAIRRSFPRCWPQGPEERGPRHGGDAHDAKNRYRRPEAGVRRANLVAVLAVLVAQHAPHHFVRRGAREGIARRARRARERAD